MTELLITRGLALDFCDVNGNAGATSTLGSWISANGGYELTNQVNFFDIKCNFI